MTLLLRVLALWRGQAVWLLVGLAVTLAALAAGVGLMVLAGATLASLALGIALAPLLLRGFGLARVALRYFERLTTHEATFRALAALRVWFFRGLARSSAGGLGFRRAGDVLTRLVNDVQALDALYISILLPLCGACLLLPALIVLIGMHSLPLAATVGVLFALAAFVLPWIVLRLAGTLGSRLTAASSALRIAVLDAIAGLREVRAFGAEGRMLASMQSREGALLAAQRDLAGRVALANSGAFLCGQFALLAVLVASSISPLVAIPAAFLVLAAFEAAGGLPRAGALAGHAVAAARRVLEAAETPPAVSDPAAPARMPSGSALRFDRVVFRWRPDRPYVFEGLTLDVPEGSRVAILGPSGVGKSTLAALALRLATPQRGKVLLGGTDVATLSANGLHARIGYLSQATHLFDDTIRANLLLARPEADEPALWAALDAARIGDVVRALPVRLDTWVGEHGARFSGGQGRRLALARALLSPARVL
ncbi:MAG: ATP-binding cassette domain-containing protein, partial [Alphaproteobacteria bacterium]|nr:ATP-binding cassette domain-containing protein [Alphaproteobacteria bacterium]